MSTFIKKVIPIGVRRSLVVRRILIRLFGAPIRVWYFREKRFTNFGDELTVDIITRLFKKRTVLVDVKDTDLIGVGSIISQADQPVRKKSYVWGAGLIEDGDAINNKNLIFKAVRGKCTRGRLPKKYKKITIGDPGLLSNLIYERGVKEGEGLIGVIPHYVDVDNPIIEELERDNRYLVISVKDTPSEVARKITSCKVVFSSSLHGLIVSDSFGVPNIHLPLSDKLKGGLYKFKDYYSSIGREYVAFEESNLFDPSGVNDVINNYRPVENLERIQKKLIRSFPFR